MRKIICDTCRREIEAEGVIGKISFPIKTTHGDGFIFDKEMEVCRFCQGEIIDFLKELKQ